MKNRILMRFLVLVCCSASLMCAGCAKKVFTIGGLFPMSGPLAFFGNESKDGIMLAIDKINAEGGVLGSNLVLICEDDEGNPDKAVKVFNKLVTKDKVSIVIGSSISGTTIPVSALAQQSKVILISPTATNIAVTQPGDYVFRACFIDPFQGVVGAEFAYNTLGNRRAAILYDGDAAYNTGLAEAFSDHFKVLGGEVVANETYKSGDTDFSAQVSFIKSVNPDVVYLPNYFNDAAIQAKELRDEGINCVLVGGDGWDGLIDIATDDLLNCYWSSGFAADTSDPWGMAFAREFEARYHRPATQYSALSYDAMMIVVDGIRAAGTFAASAVKDTMARTNGNYVTGSMQFDSDRNPIKGAAINEIVKNNGKFANAYKITINPK